MRSAACLFSLMACCMGQPLRTGATADISPAFARQNVTVTTFADAAFQAKLSALMPAGVISELNQILPYILIIENHAQLPITKITARFERARADGSLIQCWAQADLRGAGVLAPEGVMIHTPRSDLSQTLLAIRSGKSPPPGNVASLAAQILSSLFDSRRFLSTVVSLDSIVFSNGGVVGPDKFDVIAQATASEDALSAVLQQVSDASLNDSELNAWLQQQATQPAALAAQPDGSINHAVSAQIAQAQAMRSYLAVHGRPIPGTKIQPPAANVRPFRLDQ